MLCIGVILIIVGSPFHRRYLTLHALIILNKVLIICGPALISLLLRGEIAVVLCQIAIARSRLRYLLIKNEPPNGSCAMAKECVGLAQFCATTIS